MNTQGPLILICATLLIGCGSGSGSSPPPGNGTPPGNGNDNGGDPPPAAGTLAQLQADIFGPICAQCHIGGGAPEGLRLDTEQNSFDFLVDQPSSQQPDLLRVEPGNPDDSYLVRKVEGASGITGSQMPQGGPSLSSERMGQIRDWIANGAPREGTSDAPTSVSLARLETGADDSRTFTLRFSRPVDTTNVDQALEVYGHHGNQRSLLWWDAYELETVGEQTVIVRMHQPDWPVDSVEVVVNSPASSLLDHNRQPVDANRDGREGGSAHYEYRLD